MKLLKENYDGLQEIITISRDLKAILLEPDIQKALQNNDFDMIYDTLSSNLTSQFTQLMASLNVDPLNYLEYIPDGFLANTSLKSIDIPDHIKEIGDGAFSDCFYLEYITIPDSVTSIDNSVFYNCSNLKSITIPDKVTRIYSFTFYNCSSLKSITISGDIRTIDNYAFRGCSDLTSVTMSNRVKHIGNWAFKNCISLTAINYTGTKDQWSKIKLEDEWDENSPIKTIHCIDGDITL